MTRIVEYDNQKAEKIEKCLVRFKSEHIRSEITRINVLLLQKEFSNPKYLRDHVEGRLKCIREELDHVISLKNEEISSSNKKQIKFSEWLCIIAKKMESIRNLVYQFSDETAATGATITSRSPKEKTLSNTRECMDMCIEESLLISPMITTLKKSYDHLPTNLKLCTLCLAGFPENFIIQRRPLIYWWMAEGFVTKTEKKSAEAVGEENFMQLIRLGFIKPFYKGEASRVSNLGVRACTVHPWIRKMLVSIAMDAQFVEFYGWQKKNNIPGSHHVCLFEDGEAEDRSFTRKIKMLRWLEPLIMVCEKEINKEAICDHHHVQDQVYDTLFALRSFILCLSELKANIHKVYDANENDDEQMLGLLEVWYDEQKKLEMKINCVYRKAMQQVCDKLFAFQCLILCLSKLDEADDDEAKKDDGINEEARHEALSKKLSGLEADIHKVVVCTANEVEYLHQILLYGKQKKLQIKIKHLYMWAKRRVGDMLFAFRCLVLRLSKLDADADDDDDVKDGDNHEALSSSELEADIHQSLCTAKEKEVIDQKLNLLKLLLYDKQKKLQMELKVVYRWAKQQVLDLKTQIDNRKKNCQELQRTEQLFAHCDLNLPFLSPVKEDDDDGDYDQWTKAFAIININKIGYLDMKEEMMGKLNRLRMLHLGRWGDHSWPPPYIAVENTLFLDALFQVAKNLKYLSLKGVSRITALPRSISNCCNLQVLDLKDCNDLEHLPSEIGLLFKLTYLDVSQCYMLRNINLLQLVAKLKLLRVLKGLALKQEPDFISLNSNITGSSLTKLSFSVYSERMFIILHLERLHNLCVLTITWRKTKWVDEDEDEDEDIDEDSFELPPKLRKLDLRMYPGKNWPTWLVRHPSLETLYITGGEMSGFLIYPMLEKLQVLRLKFLPGFGKDIVARRSYCWFPSLKLYLYSRLERASENK